ncbi:MAG: hypothetical protein QOG99_2614 [Frankiales bacterium]|jgi:hypothetical protein|nr:hypothetical protein [Frankiales bacterium]
MTTQPDRAEIEAAARRYLATVARRYIPALAAAVALLLVIAFVPTVAPLTVEASGSTGAGEAATTGNATGGTTGVPGGSSTGASTTGGAGTGTTPGNVPGPGGSLPPNGGGTTIAGAACRQGGRQLPVSKYSVLCKARFTGNNGGTTAPGVTASTINVTFRTSHSGESGAVEAASPSLKASQEAYFQDVQTYTKYFNTKFELYGRTVKLKLFKGQGDWVSEYQGQNLAGAQADADTAKGLNAFADISSEAVGTTPAYAQYLAEDKIITLGGVAASQHFFEQYRPFAYSFGTSVSNYAQWAGNTACQRMVGLPAIFAGDATYTHTKRVFGLVYPNNPDFQRVGKDLAARLTACGGKPAKTYEFTLNLSTLASDSANAMAQMRSAGVTTVICACDTVSPQFFTQAADGQQYHPEWMAVASADSFGQGYSQTQWSHALSNEGTFKPQKQTEAYRVFKLANPKGEPAEAFYAAAYLAALNMFNALQSAGPDLTPANLERGFFQQPASAPGADFGPWAFGPKQYTPASGAQAGWYNPNAVSGQNGAKGAFLSCGGADGEYRPWDPQSGYGPAHTQLHCFGR